MAGWPKPQMITLFHGAIVRRAAPIIEAPPALRAVCAQLGRHAVPSRAPLWFADAASVALLHVRIGPWLRAFTEEALPWPDGIYRCEAALALSEPLFFTPALLSRREGGGPASSHRTAVAARRAS